MKKIIVFCAALMAIVYSCQSDGADTSSMAEGVTDGQGGSLAVFALKGNYLYTVDYTSLNVFSLVDNSGPVKVNEVHVGFNIETLFSDAEYLYIGSQNGMFIYQLENPESPVYLSSAEHFTACDPVVSNGSHAFVTLHSNSWCGNDINALMVYDLADPNSPKLIHQRTLSQPKGLGLYGNYLVVCDDEIKIFDVTNPAEPQLATAINKTCHDVIIRDNTLFAVGDNAVYRYDLNQENIADFTLVSELSY